MITWFYCKRCGFVFTKVLDTNHHDSGRCSFCHRSPIKRVRLVHTKELNK